MKVGIPLYLQDTRERWDHKAPPQFFCDAEMTLAMRCRTGDIEGLQRHIPLRWVSSYRHMKNAVLSGDLRTVQFVHRYYPYPVNNLLVLHATKDNFLDITQYLHSHNRFIFNHTIANNACKHGRLHILKWLWSKHVLPNSTGLLEAVRYSQSHVVYFLLKKGYLPTTATWHAAKTPENMHIYCLMKQYLN